MTGVRQSCGRKQRDHYHQQTPPLFLHGEWTFAGKGSDILRFDILGGGGGGHPDILGGGRGREVDI